MKIYNKYILPKILDFTCSLGSITKQRKKVIPLAKGNVLEIGIGSGRNIPFYDPKKIKNIYGIDSSFEMLEIFKKNSENLSFSTNFIYALAESIPFCDNSVDTIVITYTLCSIFNVEYALKEMRRVLKPGGELIFCEHGKAPDKYIIKVQDFLNPIWLRFSGGCNLNRNIPLLIEQAGFKIKKINTMYTMKIFKTLIFNYWGIAV